MKRDPLAEHKKRMQELQAAFSKKIQYHQQKSYLELKDIYWLCHEFFTNIYAKEQHFTEEELMVELNGFKHEFLNIPPELREQWRGFFKELSRKQYAGEEYSQEALKQLLANFSSLVDQTLGKAPVQQDPFSQRLQAAQLLVKNREFAKAEEDYRQLMQLYPGLSAEQKEKYYPHLETLYESILASRSAQQATHQ